MLVRFSHVPSYNQNSCSFLSMFLDFFVFLGVLKKSKESILDRLDVAKLSEVLYFSCGVVVPLSLVASIYLNLFLSNLRRWVSVTSTLC